MFREFPVCNEWNNIKIVLLSWRLCKKINLFEQYFKKHGRAEKENNMQA